MKLNLDDFKETLPYASELFGVYQPLLGWRSQIISRRIEKGRTAAFVELTERALSQVKPPASLAGVPEGALGLSVLRDPLVLEIAPVLDSCVARHLVGSLRDTDHINWKAILAPTSLNALLKASRDDIDHFYAGNKAEVSPLVLPYLAHAERTVRSAGIATKDSRLQHESKIGGYLYWLGHH